MPTSQEFALTEEYAALVRNQYAGLTESPHLFTIKARLYELLHVLLEPHDPLAPILFNLFDEMNTLWQLDEDSAWILEEARDIAYVYTRHFHDSLEQYRALMNGGAPERSEEATSQDN